VRFLLAAGVDAGAEDGMALIQACFRGHVRVVQRRSSIDVGSTLTPWHRNVALYKACSAGRTACCELLLERGADIHYSGDAALWFAACHVWPSSWIAAPMPGQRLRCSTPRTTTTRRSSRCCWRDAQTGPPAHPVIALGSVL
jgi:hypothetical protein